MAESVACLIYVPVDVIKERIQVQTNTDTNGYKGGFDALKKISKTEGLAGIYRGYGATLASFGPFSALYFVFYEKFKVWSRNFLEDNQNQSTTSPMTTTALPFHWIIMSSASAGAVASFLTSPLDMAKLRLQIQRGAKASAAASSSSGGTTATVTSYRGVIDALQYAYTTGGIRGLFRGAGARVLHFVPATTVTMTSYETCRNFFQKALE